MADRLVEMWGHNSDCKSAELLDNSKAALLVERVVVLKADLLAESMDDLLVVKMVEELVGSLVVSKVAL